MSLSLEEMRTEAIRNKYCQESIIYLHKVHSKQEFYEHLPMPVFMVRGFAELQPEMYFEAIVRLIQRLPIEDAPQDLIEAREALMNYKTSTPETLHRHLQAIAYSTKPFSKWQDYYKVVRRMILMLLRERPTSHFATVMDKLTTLMPALGLTKEDLIAWMKDLLPYEKWSDV